MPRDIHFGDETYLCKAVYADYYSGGTNQAGISKMQSMLKKAIASELTYPQRYCLTEYYLHSKKMKDIASELGVNPSTVTRHISKAREKLRKIAAYY